MPIGNLTSQLFANVYLNELDQLCKHELRLHYYIRYMDDVIILLNDPAELRRIKAEIEEFLNLYLHLDLNKKTAIRPCKLGVDFCGYRIWATHRKLKKQTARRIMRSVKKMCEMVSAGEMVEEQFKRAAASYSGVLQHCNSRGLRNRLNGIYEEYEQGRKQPEPEAQTTQEEARQCERSCYNCKHFFTSYFCGYEECRCKVYGSLDVSQNERHPDMAAETCEVFHPK